MSGILLPGAEPEDEPEKYDPAIPGTVCPLRSGPWNMPVPGGLAGQVQIQGGPIDVMCRADCQLFVREDGAKDPKRGSCGLVVAARALQEMAKPEQAF